ncbi:MAG: LPS export ABC transporter periplasmic protein LptC [Elusimicrobiales bacterium]|nr:LPS export ABC transporter periplasmic protein LptC [Elusimicrobiales bacterium]
MPETTFIKNLEISSYHLENIKWILRCKFAEIDEIKNTIKCNNASVFTYQNNKVSSEMKSQYGYADLTKKLFYLEKDAMVKSYSENIWLVTDKIYFDYHTEKIFSNINTTIYKNNIRIDSKGFEASSDLSNIKIKKHTTQIINN